MSLPPLIKENEPSEAEWKRRVRDLLNLTVRRTSATGTTSERPKNPAVGQTFYDETLGKPIWAHVSGVWKDAAGTTV